MTQTLIMFEPFRIVLSAMLKGLRPGLTIGIEQRLRTAFAELCVKPVIVHIRF
ncbi:hypothetical protein TRICHSKD4_4579 [Roseibium sp. TrichSKD4]|nr:hypothetical protein TRICHSKD4_4579 [Roseibium sp. TrichSKD4]